MTIDFSRQGVRRGGRAPAARSTTGRSAARAGTGRRAAAAGRSAPPSPPGGGSGASAAPARPASALSVEPGRSTTTIGARSAISRQRRQRWNWPRLSAPMIQTKRTPGRAAAEPGERLVGVARADLGLEAGHRDARVARQPPRRLDPRPHRRESAWDLQRVAGRDEPPQPVEAAAGAARARRSADGPACGGLNEPPSRPIVWPGAKRRQARRVIAHAPAAASSSRLALGGSASMISSSPSPSIIRSRSRASG